MSKIRERLRICFNGIELDLQRLEFDDYQFEEELWVMHRHNAATNRLTLHSCPTVLQSDFVEMRAFCSQSLSEKTFQRFALMYPSVSHVILYPGQNLGTFRNGWIELFQFFEQCKGLQKLEFQETELQTDFYDQLSQMDCCHSLTHLTILETTAFTHCIDFAFLTNLRFLVLFETNAAPRARMLDCLKRMRVSPKQQFAFRFRMADVCHYRHIFLRSAPHKWAPTFEHSDDGEFWEITSATISIEYTWNNLQEFLNSLEKAYLTLHWINVDGFDVPGGWR